MNKVLIPVKDGTSLPKMAQWAKANCESFLSSYAETANEFDTGAMRWFTVYVFRFEQEQDAILFRLRWS